MVVPICVLHPRVRKDKTTLLQKALLNDNIDAIVSFLKKGTLPHAMYSKALHFKAWATINFLLNTPQYLPVLTAMQWKNVLDLPVAVEPSIVRNALCALPNKGSSSITTMVAWEQTKGLRFNVEDYHAKWASHSTTWFVRNSMRSLACVHRFDVVEDWLVGIPEPSAHEWLSQSWVNAVRTDNLELWKWLGAFTTRVEQVSLVAKGIWKGMIPLCLQLRTTKPEAHYPFDSVLTRWAADWDVPLDVVLGCLALLGPQSRRPLVRFIQDSLEVTTSWKLFFESNGTQPCATNAVQHRVALLWHLGTTEHERLSAFLTDSAPVELHLI